MQGKSSATARIQRNHQTTTCYCYDTQKIRTIFCHCKHTVKNTQLFTTGARIWRKPKPWKFLWYGNSHSLEKEKERNLDKGGKIIKTLILEEKD